MATQNFVAGGFYGKLGAMVGQRWRNKRIVRAYAVPANPRTPEQQGNRARFAMACSAAQEAMIFNKNAPCWNYEGKTEWMARVGEAKTRIDNGITGWLAVPLYPSGTTPEMTITDIQSSTGSGGGVLLQSAALATLTVSRKFTLQVKMLEQASGEMVSVYLEGNTVAGNADLVEINPDAGYSLTANSTIVGITNDDEEHEGKIIYIAPQIIDVPQNVTITDAALSYADSTHVLVSSEQAKALGYAYGISIAITLTDGTTGNAKNVTATTTNTVGNATLASVEIAATDVLYSNANATFTITSTPSGAPELVVNPATASLGQKEIAVTLTTPAASLTASNRKAGTFTASGLSAATDNAMTATAKATFTDFKGTAHSAETAATITAQTQTGASISAALSFAEAPIVFDPATVTLEGYVQNTWLKQTFTATADITDATQQKIALSGWQNANEEDYLTAYAPLPASTASALGGITLSAWITGNHVAEMTMTTEKAMSAWVSSGDAYVTTPYIAWTTECTWPLANGKIVISQDNFATAANAYVFDCGASASLGKIVDPGIETVKNYIMPLWTEADVDVGSPAAAYVDYGRQITKYRTEYKFTEEGTLDDNEGGECRMIPRGTIIGQENTEIEVPFTAVPDSSFDADDIWGYTIMLSVQSDILDWEVEDDSH